MSEKNTTSQTKLNTNRQYMKKLDDIKIRVPSGYRKKLTDYCDERHISLNQLVIRLLNDELDRTTGGFRIPYGVKETEKEE